MTTGRFSSLIFSTGLDGTDNGDGSLTVVTSGAPPTGAAGGGLAGTYPNPTLSAAAIEAAGTWEIVMADGVTAPPVPVTNEAEDDWLYVFV